VWPALLDCGDVTPLSFVSVFFAFNLDCGDVTPLSFVSCFSFSGSEKEKQKRRYIAAVQREKQKTKAVLEHSSPKIETEKQKRRYIAALQR